MLARACGPDVRPLMDSRRPSGYPVSVLPRRAFLSTGLLVAPGLAVRPARAATDVNDQLLATAARYERARRAEFAAVRSRSDLLRLQGRLREKLMRMIGGLPSAAGSPPVRKMDLVEADDYTVEKIAYESLPGFFVSALLYRPKPVSKTPLPAILSPCGHSGVSKAEQTYQMMHINLVKRGFIVLTYDPVGQGERSQFWDRQKGKSRFGLGCNEHAVLGNPLYLLGANLARYRIWDGMRGIDVLASLPEVDATKIGCVGNSGGGTLTSYIAALDSRVAASAPCCYITSLPRRMATRQDDAGSDPEQDLFGFVSENVDHAGLLGLIAPRPLLVGAAVRDFFPIDGTRATFAEVARLYQVAGARDRASLVEADEKHGMTLPLREAVYGWFERWLPAARPAGSKEIPVQPRSPQELWVSDEGQVNATFRSKDLLSLARDEQSSGSPSNRKTSLRKLLALGDPDAGGALTEIAPGGRAKNTLILCINGSQTRPFEDEALPARLAAQGYAVSVLDPRGVGRLRARMTVGKTAYAHPHHGAEQAVAFNAFVVGRSLVGMRVADVIHAVASLRRRGRRLVLVGRADAAWVAALAAAVAPEVGGLAVEGLQMSFRRLFEPDGMALSAASILPNLLRDFGDVEDVLAAVSPRPLLLGASSGELGRALDGVTVTPLPFSEDPDRLVKWLGG
jgi:cephalosporin-C deacetylase-like acetyl esterase